MFGKKKQMARKDNFTEEEYEIPKEEEKPLKPLFKKQTQEPQQETQVRIVSENELLHLRLNEISAKLDEILAFAKQ